jgi:carbon-monoxide dehydrogenase medium subunit
MADTLSYLLRLPKFKHFESKTVQEACTLLLKYKGKAKLIAGGTDLLVSMKRRELTPNYLVNIKGISGLNSIDYQRKTLKIGVLATLNDIERSALVQEKFPVLASACHLLGTPLIRNLGTIGGNLCNASPSAETAPCLIGLGAKVKVVGLKGEKTIPLEKFFVGPGRSALQDGEMMTEIQVPSPPPGMQSIYLKLPARTAIDIAVVSVAVIIQFGSKNNEVSDIKIVLGAVAPTPMRAHRAEKVLKEKAIEDKRIEEAAQIASEEAKPISDIRASEDYRRQMVKVLTDRAIKQLTNLSATPSIV